MPREAGPLLPNFNALPAPYQPKQISMTRLMAIPATAVAIGLIVVLAMTIQDAAAKLASAQGELDSNTMLLEKRQAQKKELIGSVAALEQQVAGAEAARSNFTAAFTEMGKTGDKMNNDLLTTLNNIVPDLTIESISYSKGGMSLAGTAVSEQEVMAYVRKLTATGRFNEITIASLAQRGDLINYSLVISLKEGVY
jgi:Tfp pilus assembly protein PilN